MVPVCDACVGHVARNVMLGCKRCGEAINLDLCRECRLATPEFARAVAYASYDNEMRGLIRLLKFERVRGVARLMGRRMAEGVMQLEGEAAMEMLMIAVPLFKARERQRGYNQSVLLADEALGWLRKLRPEWKLIAAHKMLERRRSTESSFVLSRKGRRRNLSGAFAVRGDVRGREVLLIDDILTSGATARECARVLMRAGATKVWVATLARAQKRFITRQHEDSSELVAKWDRED
jgi:ComF family protein